MIEGVEVSLELYKSQEACELLFDFDTELGYDEPGYSYRIGALYLRKGNSWIIDYVFSDTLPYG